jgi:hypothetical protein
MRRGFSLINLLIIIGLITMAFLGYREYKKSLITKNSALENQSIQSAENTVLPVKTDAKQPAVDSSKNKNAEPIAQPKPTAAKQSAKPSDGFYENTTYHYSLKVPPAWPIRVRSENNISFGTVPPQNGQGAITIEINKGGSNNEVAQAKAEAAKYPGLVSLTEESFTLAGVSGTKITLNNFMSKAKNIYILLIKDGLNYIIKYSEESAAFSEQAEQALKTFKFTR